MYKADGFEGAKLGIMRRCGQKDIMTYDYGKCVKILMDRDGMSYDDAVEFMEFNVVGAWIGAETPGFVDTNMEAYYEEYRTIESSEEGA
jgi:hypothetical protein